MTKIVFAIRYDYQENELPQIEKWVKEIADEIKVEVKVVWLPEQLTEKQIQVYVEKWETAGADVLLCRGMLEDKCRKYAKHMYVMGMRYTFDTMVENLYDYQQLHPGFFEGKRKRVLSISRQKIFLNEEILEKLFGAKVTNISTEQFAGIKELVDFAKQFDLVIAGTSYKEIMENNGIRCHHQKMSERLSLIKNLEQADSIIKARLQLQEKNNEIQNLLDNSFHAIVGIDCDRIIRQGNIQVKKYFDKSLSEMIDRNIYEILPDLQRELVDQLIENHTEFYGELMEYRQRMLVMNGFPLYNQNRISGAVIHFEELYRIEQVEEKLQTEYYNKGLTAHYNFEDILGCSPQLSIAKKYGEAFAKHNSNILIYGESGTGKELFAQSIHNASARKNGPFVAINCGALPSSLLESELFGYVGGAFTGASKSGKKGLLELANKGTIFLDEISEMDMNGQIRLLRVLEERVVSRIGDDKVIPLNVRIIAASNKNLNKMVEEGRFREDLYYRLNVLMLRIPALREREGDIVLLARHFLAHFGKINKKQVELSEDAARVLSRYRWKGNVRQLRNFCERLNVIANSQVVEAAFVIRQLEDSYFEPIEGDQNEVESLDKADECDCLMERMARLNVHDEGEEKELILKALNAAEGNRGRAAQILGISKSGLWRKIKKYGIVEKY